MSWTVDEKELLVRMYPIHTDRELCDLLGKTSGQLRGMKERLGLNKKNDVFTAQEKETIRQYYLDHPGSIDLDHLSRELCRPKTSIARFDGKENLTKQSRPLTQISIDRMKTGINAYRHTDRYITEVYPKSKELLTWYAQNAHPRGMSGKHHSATTRLRMSSAHKGIWDGMDAKSRADLCNRIRSGIIKNVSHGTTGNSYSRCHGGIRSDLGCYFRSSWEANMARVFNACEIPWVYEPCRFFFKDKHDGVNSYQPDFYLPTLDLYVEVKGWFDPKSILRLEKCKEEHRDVFDSLAVIDEDLYKSISSVYSTKIPEWES